MNDVLDHPISQGEFSLSRCSFCKLLKIKDERKIKLVILIYSKLENCRYVHWSLHFKDHIGNRNNWNTFRQVQKRGGFFCTCRKMWPTNILHALNTSK